MDELDYKNPEGTCKIGEIIYAKFDEDLKISSQTLMNDIDRMPKVLNRWCKELYDAKDYLSTLICKKIEVEESLELSLKTSDDPRLMQLGNNSRKLKDEIKKKPTYKKICKKINNQERLIVYLEDIVVGCKYHLNDRIKSRLKLMEMENK